MDLDKFEKMVELAQKSLSGISPTYLYKLPVRRAEIENLMYMAMDVLPDHTAFFVSVTTHILSVTITDAQQIISHLKAIMKLERRGEKRISEMKIFESADEKMKQVGLSFRKEDYSSTFNNLNAALELVLKDKCDIPTTITGINTSNVIDLLVKYKVEPFSHFKEAGKRVTEIANRAKHQGYVPSKNEAILGIKAMEELITKLRDREIKLTAEIEDKIYKGL